MKSDQTPPRLRRLLVALGAATLLAGCATTGSVPHPDDPYEGFNRGMFKFNQRVDKYTLRPVARVYDTVAPNVVQKGVTNFFGNIGDIWIGANNILQGKVGDGIQDWMRFLVNSTWGIGGLIDIASDAGLTKHDEDFGQTLAVWGVVRARMWCCRCSARVSCAMRSRCRSTSSPIRLATSATCACATAPPVCA